MWALNEVQGLVTKAARGAGFPVGQAEDLGRVAAYLAGTGGRLAPVTQALQETPVKAEVSWDVGSVTIKVGAAVLIAPIVCDAFAMGYEKAVLADVNHAPLVAAFLAADGIAQKWDGTAVMRSDTTVLQPGFTPVSIPEADWHIWQALARQTYVPETEASRVTGAGAGLTDND